MARLFVLLAVLFLIFAPAVLTLGWHSLHGETIQTRGKTIHVPMAWIAERTDSLDVMMTKLPKTVFGGDRFYGWITVGRSVLSPCKKEAECNESWKAEYWNISGDNAVVSGPLRMGPGGRQAFCMESFYPAAPTQVSLSCLILHGTWRADFRGDKKDLETFVQIIQKIQ